MSYTKRGIESLNLLKRNLILFVPDIIYLAIFVITALIFLQLTGLLSSIFNNFYNLDALKTQFQSIISNTPALIKLLIALLIFIIINFTIGLGLQAVKYDMIRSLLKTKKIKFKESLRNSKNYFFTMLSVKILIYLMILLPLSIPITLQILLNQTALLIILLFIILIFYIYLILSILFIYPIIFTKENKPLASLKESFLYFKNNKKHTVLTFLFIIAVSIVLSYLINIFQFGVSFLPSTMAMVITIFLNVFGFIINKIVVIWREIFLFLSYLKKD